MTANSSFIKIDPFYKKNLFLRLLTSVIVIPLVIFILLYGHYSIYLFFSFVLFNLLREWSLLFIKESLLGVNSLISLLFLGIKITSFPLLIYFFPIILIIYYSLKNCSNLSFLKSFYFLSGISFFFFSIHSFSEVITRPFPYYLYSFWLLGLIWSTDSGAYVMGSLLKGPLLAPKISPNKTWAGVWGGLFFALIFSLSFLSFFPETPKIFGSRILEVFLFSLIGQLGDLIESFIKRCFNVKDSGSFLPGHGGILDRLDSLLTVSAFLGFLNLFNNLYDKITP